MNNCITNSFSMIKDPRLERKKLHSLTDILVLTICAMLSGAEGYTAIEAFGHNKIQWLKGFLSLKSGIPSHESTLCTNTIATRTITALICPMGKKPQREES